MSDAATEWAQLQARAAEFLSLPDLPTDGQLRYNKVHGKGGRFASGHSAGMGADAAGTAGMSGGGSGSQGGSGGANEWDDGTGGPPAQEPDEYDNAGRFTAAHRAKYGDVVLENSIDENHSVVISDKKKLYVADDSAGTHNREVLQEFTAKGAKSLGDDVWDIHQGPNDVSMVNKSTDVGLHKDDGGRLVVKWSSGAKSVFAGDAIPDLSEALDQAADSYTTMFRSTVLSAYEVRYGSGRAGPRRWVAVRSYEPLLRKPLIDTSGPWFGGFDLSGRTAADLPPREVPSDIPLTRPYEPLLNVTLPEPFVDREQPLARYERRVGPSDDAAPPQSQTGSP